MPSLTQHASGPTYWRSLDELADTPEFRKLVQREFPSLAAALNQPATRRSFLKVMGASLALAGLTACRWPRENIVPATRQPVDRVPGIPVSYATAVELAGVATGLLVTSYDGRPIKIEGNDKHPFSRGRTTSWMQASVLDLYDPDRSIRPINRASGQPKNTPWEQFVVAAEGRFGDLRASGGAGLAVLAEPSSSPSLEGLQAQFRKSFPRAKWYTYDPLSRDNEREGSVLAFGKALRAQVDLSKADVVVSLDSDFLMSHPAAVRLANDFAKRRRADDGTMNRLYVFESGFSITGSNADHRYPAPSSAIGAIASDLLAAVGGAESKDARIAKLAADLKAHAGRAVVLVGPQQPAAVHAIGHALNHKLGAFGQTVTFTRDPNADDAPGAVDLAELTQRMSGGEIKTLVILGGNPAFTAPGDIAFAAALRKVETSFHLSPYDDETSRGCTWHVPQAHYLESWGDARAWDGTLSIVQPLIAPLYDGKTAAEFVALMVSDRLQTGYAITRRTLGLDEEADPKREDVWKQALSDGVVPDSAFKPVDAPTPKTPPAIEPAKSGDYEIVFRPDYKVLDGRSSNNGWLQELPDPISKITWDNAALVSPADAAKLGVDKPGRVLRIELAGKSIEVPAYVLPGQAPGSITLTLGYGRGEAAGKVGMNVGVDVSPIRVSSALWIAPGAKVSNTGAERLLVSTQEHHPIRSAIGDAETQRRIPVLIREATLEHYQEHPDFVHHVVHLPQAAPLWEQKAYDGHKWGMAIDLSACTGCSACVTACQAENNVPVVGKEEVSLGREMHWLRIDRYFKGEPESPEVEVVHQPMACVQCENAPCEQVCPVGATMHDEEGLNAMVYNRCIGTRYCSNNCPYKVRRFNWYYNQHGPYHPRSLHADPGGPRVGLLGPTKANEPLLVPTKMSETPLTDVEKMGKNPFVTVRSRGVMEKCTYCTQRINDVKIRAKNERWATIPDGLITPACAQSCPTEAIVFGDLNDPQSRVAKAHKVARAYETLEELNLLARTRYLARLKNPAESGEGRGEEHEHG